MEPTRLNARVYIYRIDIYICRERIYPQFPFSAVSSTPRVSVSVYSWSARLTALRPVRRVGFLQCMKLGWEFRRTFSTCKRLMLFNARGAINLRTKFWLLMNCILIVGFINYYSLVRLCFGKSLFTNNFVKVGDQGENVNFYIKINKRLVKYCSEC